MKRTAKFKTPGDSVTIGNQRFDAGNITPAIVDALIAIDAKHADHFEIVEAEDDKTGSEGSEETASKPSTRTAKAAAKE